MDDAADYTFARRVGGSGQDSFSGALGVRHEDESRVVGSGVAGRFRRFMEFVN